MEIVPGGRAQPGARPGDPMPGRPGAGLPLRALEITACWTCPEAIIVAATALTASEDGEVTWASVSLRPSRRRRRAGAGAGA
jgi:hypothetical protein